MFLPCRVPLTICGSFLWLPLVLIPPWRATVNPTISDALGSGRLVCCLRIFVSEKASPNYFQILLCSSPQVFLKCWGCLVSGGVLNRWKGSLFKLFRLFDCYETVWRRVYLLHGTRAPSAFYYICSGGFPPFLSVRKSSYLGRAINSAASCNRNRKTHSSHGCF